jgi:hypothetical protein
MNRDQKQSAVERWREKEAQSRSKLRIAGTTLFIFLASAVLYLFLACAESGSGGCPQFARAMLKFLTLFM